MDFKITFESFFEELFPVFFCLLFLLCFSEMVDLFRTNLGKICAIYLILVYSFLDKYYGLCVCFGFILFYQIYGDEFDDHYEEKIHNSSNSKASIIPLITPDVISLLGIGNIYM
jgi:hypothetical protein